MYLKKVFSSAKTPIIFTDKCEKKETETTKTTNNKNLQVNLDVGTYVSFMEKNIP